MRLLLAAVISCALLSGCASVATRPKSVEPTATAPLNVWELRPLIEATSDDFLSARRVAAAATEISTTPDDFQVVSTQPEIPREWWQRNATQPYKMVHLRADGPGGVGSSDIDCWSSQLEPGSVWECTVVRSGGY